VYDVRLKESVSPALLIIAVAGALFWMGQRFVKDAHRVGLAVSLFAVLFFSYQNVWNVMTKFTGVFEFQWWGVDIGPHEFLYSMWILIFLTGLRLIARKSFHAQNLTPVLNAVAAVMVLFNVANIAYHKSTSEWRTSKILQERGGLDGSSEVSASFSGGVKPDIYYIVLDEYPSEKVWQMMFHYKNRSFLKALEERGFSIIPDAMTNYPSTAFSLAASTSMDYVGYLDDYIRSTRDETGLVKIVVENKAAHYLKSQGYTFVQIVPPLSVIRDVNPNADINITAVDKHNLLLQLLRTTILNVHQGRFFVFLKDDIRRGFLRAFQELKETHKIQGPKFVFAHFQLPHGPIVFGPNGEPVNHMRVDRIVQDEKTFVDQLIYLNKELLEIVDALLAHNESDPIIILQGDHGTRLADHYPDIEREKRIFERMTILNAFYLPGDGKQMLYDEITPVNTFRLLFNHYLGAHYTQLADRAFWDFKDVTDEVRTASKFLSSNS